MADKSIWLRTAEFISGTLLAGGKAGDPFGQQTYAAHGQEGAKIQLQSQRGQLGAPRGPGGYHERTGADIAKRVEGTWHDYGLGMTVPLGLLASQVASEASKSFFREDETFGEAIRDPLGVVTAFKDTAANIKGLREGGYKTTYDYLTDFGGGISNFFSSFATGGTFTGGTTGGLSLPTPEGIEALPVVSSLATLAKRLLNIEEILAKQNQLLAIIQKAFSGMATIAGPAEEEETEDRLTEKKTKAQGMGFKKRFKKLTKQTAVWGSLLFLLASWIQGGKDVEDKSWFTKMGGSLLHWLTGGVVGFTDDDVEERAVGGQTRTYATGGTFTSKWQNPNATATSSGYSPAPLEEKKEGVLSKVVSSGLSRVLATSTLKPVITLANLAVMAEQRGWVGEGFVKVPSYGGDTVRGAEADIGPDRPGAGEPYLRGGKVVDYNLPSGAVAVSAGGTSNWQDPNKSDWQDPNKSDWQDPNLVASNTIPQFAAGGQTSGSGSLSATPTADLGDLVSAAAGMSIPGYGDSVDPTASAGPRPDRMSMRDYWKSRIPKKDRSLYVNPDAVSLVPKDQTEKDPTGEIGRASQRQMEMDIAGRGKGGALERVAAHRTGLRDWAIGSGFGAGQTAGLHRAMWDPRNVTKQAQGAFMQDPISGHLAGRTGPGIDPGVGLINPGGLARTGWDAELLQKMVGSQAGGREGGELLAAQTAFYKAVADFGLDFAQLRDIPNSLIRELGKLQDIAKIDASKANQNWVITILNALRLNLVKQDLKEKITGGMRMTAARMQNLPSINDSTLQQAITIVPPEQIQVGSDAIKSIAETVVIDALGAKIVSHTETTYNYIIDAPFTGVTEIVDNYGTLIKDDSGGVPDVPGLR